MYPSVSYAGSTYRGGTGFFNYTANVAGSTWTMNLAATGGTGFESYVNIFRPDGGTALYTYTTTTSTVSQSGVAGTYSAIAVKGDANDITGTYTVKLTGAGAALPNNAKQDGWLRTIAPAEAALAAASG